MDEFRDLYRVHYEKIFKYLFYLTGDWHIAEELLQETFFQAYVSIHRFKGNSKIQTWLFQIAKFTYLKYKDKNMKMKFISNDNLENIMDSDTPDRIVVRKEGNFELMEAINKLQEPYKEVVILRSFNELDYKDISEFFAKNENWARVTFHRGKQLLKKILKEAKHNGNTL